MEAKVNFILPLSIYILIITELFKGKVIAKAEIIKIGKTIATVKGEIYNAEQASNNSYAYLSYSLSQL